MEENEKGLIKLKFAICMSKLISKNKGLSGTDIVSSLRQLESSSGVSYPIIQLTSIAKRDIQLTTAIRLIESLNLKPSEFFLLYDNLTEEDLKTGLKEISRKKELQSKKAPKKISK